MTDTNRTVTKDLLRHRVGPGHSGEGKSLPKPASGPHGTDHTAAGSGPKPIRIARARTHEALHPNGPGTAETGPVRPDVVERRPDPRFWILLSAIAMAGAIVFAAVA